jgi:hypothetical protein
MRLLLVEHWITHNYSRFETGKIQILPVELQDGDGIVRLQGKQLCTAFKSIHA